MIATSLVHKLEQFYANPQRKYHNLDHINDMLVGMNRYDLSDTERNVLEHAIWFHDIVYTYNQKDKTNEELSAEVWRWASAYTQSTFHQHVTDLILFTDYSKKTTFNSLEDDRLKTIIVELDFNNFGKSYYDFMISTKNVDDEHFAMTGKHVDVSKKKAFLEKVLEQQIFFNFSELEKNKNRNIEKYLKEL